MTATAIETFVQTPGSSRTPQSGISLGKNDFLKLLVTQMKNQDPLDPMDGTEFTAQLAQFSSLEALQNIDGQIQNLKTAQLSANNARAADYLGKTVTAAGDRFELSGGAISDFRFRIDTAAAQTFVKIYSSTGAFVTSLDTGAKAAGEHVISWDGTDSQGIQMQDGSYFAEVVAADENGNPVEAETLFSGRAVEINFRNNTAYIMIGNREITLDDIRKISS